MAQKNNAMAVHGCWIWHPFGYVGPTATSMGMLNCASDDGSGIALNVDDWKRYKKALKESEAQAIRILPWLMPDPKADGNFWIPEGRWLGYLPWVFDRYPGDPNSSKSMFDLDRINQNYYGLWRQMVQELNGIGLRVIVPFFDRCHGEDCNISPWHKNKQGIRGLYGSDGKPHRYALEHVGRMIQAMRGLDVTWEVENEPFDERFPELFRMVWSAIQAAGYPKEKLIHGCDFIDGPPGKPKYYWKSTFVDGLGPSFRVASSSTVHNISQEKLDWLCKFEAEKREDGRRFFLSDDGLRKKWTEEQWYNALVPWLRKNKMAFVLGYYIESCYAPYPGDDGASMMAVRGIRRALDKVFAELFPADPVVPPVDPPDPPEPPTPPDNPEDPEEPPVDPPNPPDDPEDPEEPDTPDTPEEPETPEDPDDPGPPSEDDEELPSVNFKAWLILLWLFIAGTAVLLWQMIKYSGFYVWKGVKWAWKKIFGGKK